MRFVLRTIAVAALLIAVTAPHLKAQRLQWENISGGMAQGMAGIHMLNGTYIAAGMNPGGVFLSSDKGFTWSAANNGLEDTHVTSLVYDHNGATLYAAAASGQLFASMNGAANWDFHSMLPDNARTLAIEGGHLYAYGPVGNVFVYENSWLPLYAKQSEDHAAVSFKCFANGMLFVGTTAKGLYRSSDEGMTWTNVWPNNSRVAAVYSDPYDSILFISTENALRKSLDYGETWEMYAAPGDGYTPVLDFYAFDGESALAIEPVRKQIYSTGDAGASWISYPESPGLEVLFNTGNGYFIGASKTSGISATSDWGASWNTGMHSMSAKEIPSIQDYMPVTTVSMLYMGGKYVSSDGGTTWMRHPETGAQDWRDSTVYTNLQAHHASAWYMTSGPDLYLSDNQGDNWTPIFSLGTEFIVSYGVQQHAARDIVLITDAGILYYYDSQQMTANGWNSPVTNPGMVFVTSGKNVLVGDADTQELYFSSNQGESFSALSTVHWGAGESVYEYEPGVLLLGKYISTDNGASWERRRIQTERPTGAIYTIRTDNRGNTYYGTDNGVYVAFGLADALQYEGLSAPVTILEVLGDGSIAASGPGLGIVRANPDVLTGIDPVVQPREAGVVTSAPNPFVSGTSVSVTLEHAGEVTLSVYNLLGARIATLASGYHTSGTHTFTWDGKAESGSTVPAGMYLLRLNGPDGAATRQMVKLD